MNRLSLPVVAKNIRGIAVVLILILHFTADALAATSVLGGMPGEVELAETLSPESSIQLDKYSQLPNLSAVIKNYNERNPDTFSTIWVQLSPLGMRVKDVVNRSEIIKNFNQQRVWLIKSDNNFSHEIDIDFYEQEFPDLVQRVIGADTASNILGRVPCAHGGGKNMGKRYWRGQVVNEWVCSAESSEFMSTQLFSHRWNIVVQVKHSDLDIEELVDINEELYLENTFVPNVELQKVGFSEFITGRRSLETYGK